MKTLLAQAFKIPWSEGGKDTSQTVKGFEDVGVKWQFNTLGDVLSASMDYIFLFAGVGLLLMLLSGGFTLLTSAGDAKKLDLGKQQITNAILGIIIIFAAFWLVQILGTIFGFDTVKTIFG